ncbi:MAG TPA: response regulator [Bacteroidia bacterium]
MGKADTKSLIFIVDDDEDDRNFISTALQSFIDISNIRLFENGKELIEELSKGTNIPNLIVLDLNMPHMDGFEALTQIRKTWAAKDLPVIILSTSSDANDRIKCEKLGANRYITKPTQIKQYESIAGDLILLINSVKAEVSKLPY